MTNIIHWIEIPTKNIERAAAFYSAVLDINLTVMEAMGMKTSFFPRTAETQSGGCLMQGPHYEPTSKGGPGFVWRLKDQQDNALNINPFEDSSMLVNISV